MFVNTFPFFHSFPLSFAFSLEKVKWERERKRTTKHVCRARRIFEANLTGFPPLHFNPRKSPRATETDFVIALPAHRASSRVPTNWSRKTPTRWILLEREERRKKKKKDGERETRKVRKGREKKNSGSWLSSSEKEEASAMNCRAFMGGKMARRYFEEEKKSKRQHR